MKFQDWKAHLALFFVNTLYGAGHILAKGVMPNSLTPSVFILFRVLGSTALFWLVKLLIPKQKVAKKDLLLLAFCGFFGVAVNQMFFFHGLNLSSSINAGIIMTTNPILVIILAYFLIREKITVTKVSGVLIGAIGAILLTLTGSSGHGDSPLGDLFLFINAISYAVYLVIAKPLMKKYNPLTVITYVFTFGLIFVLLYPPTLSELYRTNFESLTAEIWLKITYIVIFVTFLAYLLTTYSLKFVSPAVASAYMYFQPVLVILFAVLFSYIGISDDYTNTITWKKCIYMVMIFIGVWLTTRKQKA